MSRRRSPAHPWRPSPTSGRRRLLAALLLVGVALVAFVLGRLAATPVGASATAAVQAASSSRPAVASTGEGTRLTDGVPLGYTDDERGAVAAATTFATVLSGPLALTPDEYRRAVAAMAAPNVADQLTQAAGQQTSFLESTAQLPSLAAQGVTVSLRCTPLSYEVEALTALNATVRVWSLTLMAAAGHLVPTAVWATVEYRLLWVGSDWRLERSQLVDVGWAPANVQPTPATSDIPGQLHQYREATGG